MFSGMLSLDDALDQARQFGADYVFIDKAWPEANIWTQQEASLRSGKVVVENQSALVIKVQ